MTFNPSFQTCIPCVESPVEKSNPQPSQKQEENHERERERKPGAEVDAVAVRKVTANQKGGLSSTSRIMTQFSVYALHRITGHLFSCPIRMRFGAVPVSVAVPPILAAYGIQIKNPFQTFSWYSDSVRISSTVLTSVGSVSTSVLFKSHRCFAWFSFIAWFSTLKGNGLTIWGRVLLRDNWGYWSMSVTATSHIL